MYMTSSANLSLATIQSPLRNRIVKNNLSGFVTDLSLFKFGNSQWVLDDEV